jgi:hypothetical protein
MRSGLRGPVAAVATVAAALLLAACPPADDRGAPGDAGRPDADAPGNGAAAGGPVCLQGGPFVADGAVAVRDAGPGDGDRVLALRWEGYEGCERFVVDVAAADGEAATRAGRVEAEVLRGVGVVRLSLRDVPTGNHEVTDATFDGPLARSAYTVHSPDGRWIFVDLHLGEAAEAFVTTLDDPARVVVDLRPGGPALPAPAPRERHVVLLEPRPGSATYPLRVTGYARTFEANVVARLEQNGRDVHEDFTTSTGYVDSWGYFQFTIPDGPAGRVTLRVGDYSARDGTWEGIAVPLDMARR